MDELYTRISKSTKHVLYQYMKDNDISLLNYNFNYFFQYCIQKYQIQVISHHFSNHKIEGLTVIEWSQFSPDLVPEEHLKISIQLLENGDREFTFHAIGKKYEELLEALA